MVQVQTGYADINGAKLYYEIAGEGHPLVMVHAGIADNTMWDGQFAEFAKHFRVVRYDMRGYGSSEPVDGEYSFRDDLAALIEHFNFERTYLIGCSMGGGACMDYTLMRPDHVDALVMVASGPSGLVLDIPEPPQFALIGPAFDNKDYELVNELETQVWFDGVGRSPDQVDAKEREHLKAMNREVLAHEIKGLGTRRPPMNPSAVERLDELNLPVLILYGDRDTPYTVKASQHMETHIKNARRILMSNTAHLPNMERSTEFNRIVLDFLQDIQ